MKIAQATRRNKILKFKSFPISFAFTNSGDGDIFTFTDFLLWNQNKNKHNAAGTFTHKYLRLSRRHTTTWNCRISLLKKDVINLSDLSFASDRKTAAKRFSLLYPRDGGRDLQYLINMHLNDKKEDGAEIHNNWVGNVRGRDTLVERNAFQHKHF